MLALLAPLFGFLGWAILSAGWSAIPGFSLAQAFSLVVLLLLSAVIGSLWRDERDTRTLLLHLALALLVVATAILAVDRINHDISGMNRDDHLFEQGSIGLVHPTSAGATASLGLVLVTGPWLLWGWTWTRRLLVPALVIHSALLVLAMSRMALGMAVLVVGLILLWFSPKRALAAGVFAGCVGGLLYLVIDPELSLVESLARQTSSSVSRGESAESLTSLTGRTALWDAIWVEIWQSPLIGHGYFVTSRKGLLDVWSGPANRSAHNVFLQVQVTTGLVGLLLFLWGFGQVALAVVRAALSRTRRRPEPLLGFLAVMAIWYAGWSQLCESFMGSVQPEAVVFYCVLGLALGMASRHRVAASTVPASGAAEVETVIPRPTSPIRREVAAS
ncbi:MAG: O-antigen ligase family protein [Gemmataceae bacterium]